MQLIRIIFYFFISSNLYGQSEYYLSKEDIGFDQNKYACLAMTGFYCMSSLQRHKNFNDVLKDDFAYSLNQILNINEHISDVEESCNIDFSLRGISLEEYLNFVKMKYPRAHSALKKYSFLRKPGLSEKKHLSDVYNLFKNSLEAGVPCVVGMQRVFIRNGMNTKKSITVLNRHALLVKEVRKPLFSLDGSFLITVYEPDTGDLVTIKVTASNGKHGIITYDGEFIRAKNNRIPLLKLSSDHKSVKPRIYEKGEHKYPHEKVYLESGICSKSLSNKKRARNSSP